jgi:hypothetical protein
MRGGIHPRELRERLRASPGLGRQQPRLRAGAVHPVADGDDLRERLAIDDENRHLPVRIELQIFRAPLLALVQLDELRGEVLAGCGLDRLQADVGHEGAGARAEMQFDHVVSAFR